MTYYPRVPEPYHNSGANGVVMTWAYIALSIALAAAIFFGLLQISYLWVAAPVVYLAARVSLFRLLVNAGHAALTLAENDADIRLAQGMIEEASEATTLDASRYDMLMGGFDPQGVA